jgi:hypothetical protein
MKTLLMILAIGLSQLVCKAADSYSIEATITPLRDGRQYEATARICRLVDQNGIQRQELLSNPRILSTMGEPGSFYVGPDRKSSNYKKIENIAMQVDWPQGGQEGFAVCTIVVKRGDKVISKSKTQVMVGKTSG